MIHRASSIASTFALLAVVAASLSSGGCTRRQQSRGKPPPPEVDVAHPVVRESVEWDEYTGRLAAVETVAVRARVSGFLEKIHFQAGQIVNKGDLLFTIDPRPFVAELDRANAEVKRAEAELVHAEYDLQRVEQYKRDQVAPEKEYRDTVWAKEKAAADVEQTRSQQRLAALNLEWTGVVAPIGGRISRESVTVGNLVHDGGASATVLTTIVSLDPIHCYFDVDEKAYLKYARMSTSGERISSRDKPNPVRVALFDEDQFSHEGHMDFVDNTIDQGTGTITGRAVLPNPDDILIPGLFVRLRLIGSGKMPMVFIPDAAITNDQITRLVYVVDDKNVARPRPIVTGRLQNGLRRVMSGLDGTETIVVNGIQRIRGETTVKPKPCDICKAEWMPDETPAALSTSQPMMHPASAPTPLEPGPATQPSAGGHP